MGKTSSMVSFLFRVHLERAKHPAAARG